METGKIILVLIMFIVLAMPVAYATGIATIHLDFVNPDIREGSTITFSGQLTNSSGISIPHRTIFIEDDTNYYVRPDIIIAITTTDSDGKFSASWKAVPKDNGNSFHFYAKFLGGNLYGFTRSETYESIVFHSNSSSTEVVPSKTIPIWFKNASKMWHDGQIRDIDYSWSIKNLVEHGIVNADNSDVKLKLPAWLKKNANWFAEDEISKDEYAINLGYLLENKII